jgi:hypothetical protein
MAKEPAMTDETADALAMLAYDVLKWGGGDAQAFVALVASGIDLAPPAARAGYWRLWLNRAAGLERAKKARAA